MRKLTLIVGVLGVLAVAFAVALAVPRPTEAAGCSAKLVISGDNARIIMRHGVMSNVTWANSRPRYAAGRADVYATRARRGHGEGVAAGSRNGSGSRPAGGTGAALLATGDGAVGAFPKGWPFTPPRWVERQPGRWVTGGTVPTWVFEDRPGLVWEVR